MRRRNITWVWLLGAAFMVGCGKQVPEDIIQPDRMENILQTLKNSKKTELLL